MRFLWTDVVVVVVVAAVEVVVVVLVKGRGNGHGESGHAARGIAVLMYVCMLNFLLLTSPCCNSCTPRLLSIVGKLLNAIFGFFFW